MVSVALIDSKAEGFAEGLGFCWGFGKLCSLVALIHSPVHEDSEVQQRSHPCSLIASQSHEHHECRKSSLSPNPEL